MVKKSTLAKKLAGYSVLATSVLAVEKGDAQIVTTTPASPINITSPHNSGDHYTDFYLDLNNDGVSDFRFTQFMSSNSPWRGYADEVHPLSSNQEANSAAQNYGSVINSKANWGVRTTMAGKLYKAISTGLGSFLFSEIGAFLNADNKFLPLQLVDNGQTYYGWARVSIQHIDTITISEYGFNATAGAPINAGQTGCSSTPVTPTVTLSGDSLKSTLAVTYQWYHGGTAISGATSWYYTPPTAAPADSGFYSVRTTDANGCLCQSTTLRTGIPVWPGDANEDGVVNNQDLLPIGLYNGATAPGNLRYSGNTWKASPIDPSYYFGVTQSDGFDIVYADCNGDGFINADDTMAIHLNYGLTHPIIGAPGKPEQVNGNVALTIVPDEPSYLPGDTVHAGVMLGSATAPAGNFYGIAYSITLDTTQIQPGTLAFAYYNSSFLGVKNSTTLTLTHVSGDVETAAVGSDHKNRNGYGKIGDLYFTLSNSANTNLILSVTAYTAVDSAGNQITLSAPNDTVDVTTATGINQLSINNNQLSIYPNPTTGQLTFINPSPINEITITNVLGQVVYKSFPNQNKIAVNIKDEGMYFVTVISGNESTTRKLMVVK